MKVILSDSGVALRGRQCVLQLGFAGVRAELPTVNRGDFGWAIGKARIDAASSWLQASCGMGMEIALSLNVVRTHRVEDRKESCELSAGRGRSGEIFISTAIR